MDIIFSPRFSRMRLTQFRAISKFIALDKCYVHREDTHTREQNKQALRSARLLYGAEAQIMQNGKRHGGGGDTHFSVCPYGMLIFECVRFINQI